MGQQLITGKTNKRKQLRKTEIKRTELTDEMWNYSNVWDPKQQTVLQQTRIVAAVEINSDFPSKDL